VVVGGRSHLRSSIPCRHSALWHHRLYASCLLVRVVPFRAPFLGGSFFYSYRENFKKSAAKLGGCAQAHRTFGQSRSSPTGFAKKISTLSGSIFYSKNLDSPAIATLKIGFLFLFFSRFFFCFLLKKCAKRSEQKFNGSYYAIAKHQIAQVRQHLSAAAFFYFKQRQQQRKATYSTLPELLRYPVR